MYAQQKINPNYLFISDFSKIKSGDTDAIFTMSLHSAPTIFSLTLRALSRYPEKLAFKWRDSELTYAATLKMIGRMQHVLRAQAIMPGQRLALLTANRADAWCIGIAAQGLGITTTWLHPMGAIQAHCFQLEDADVSAVLIDASNYMARGAEIAACMPGLKVFTLGAASYGIDFLSLADHSPETEAVDHSTVDGIATLNYTGGTTGRQKGVVKLNSTISQMVMSMLADFEFPLEPKFLAVAPISHVTGTNVIPTFLRGGSVYLMEKYDIEHMAQMIERERINFLMMVPTMIYALLDHPRIAEFDLSSLELLLYAGSPMSRSRLKEGVEKLGSIFSQSYGQSECFPITLLRKEHHDLLRPERLESCGFPVSACEVRVLDDKNNDVAPGEPGEICVRGPAVMQGYWRQPELTREVLVDGWLHTGDIAYADDQGLLYIVDRKKDMIVSGGFNVYPREVEEALYSHPAVSNCAVIGTPDLKWGEAVTALVVLRKGYATSSEELIAHVKEIKGSVLTPKRLDLVETLPLTALGKIDKKAIRANYWTSQTRHVG